MHSFLSALLAGVVLFAAAQDARACIKRTPTPPDAPGPHDFSTAPDSNELWREGDAGEQLVLALRILDTCGRPLPGARVHLLHADAQGIHVAGRFRAILEADERGAIDVLTVLPGYAGGISRHIHFIITHPGHRRLVTRLYFKNDPSLPGRSEDPLALVLEQVRQPDVTRWIGGYEFVLDAGKP